jgi:hypothetical protein
MQQRPGHQPSGERSLEGPFRKQRTVDPLMVPACYTFLYCSIKADLRAAACGASAAGSSSAVLSRPYRRN